MIDFLIYIYIDFNFELMKVRMHEKYIIVQYFISTVLIVYFQGSLDWRLMFFSMDFNFEFEI